MAGGVSFGDVQAVVDDAIRTVAAKWHLRGTEFEDFAQDVRVEVLRRDQGALRRFRGRGAFTYFYRIAVRVAIDRLRRECGRGLQKRRASSVPFAGRHTRERGSQRSVSNEPGSEMVALRDHVVRALTQVLDELNENERTLLARRFAEAQSAAIIAHASGVSRSSAARRLQALLDDIRDMLVLVGVSPDEVREVLAQSRIDAGLLDAPATPDPTRPDPILEAPVLARRM